MLTYLRSSIFDSPAQTLVNTVNTVGVMGKGVAKGFKTRYPAMYKEYREICDEGDLQIGLLHLWRGPDKWVLNFPTKTTWRRPSELHYVKAGLHKFVSVFEDLHISSISFPPLGCGNGNLDWAEVGPLMERCLKPLPIRVFIHDRHEKPDFVPEHLESEPVEWPHNYDEFVRDVKKTLFDKRGMFQTLATGTVFSADFDKDVGLRICRPENKQDLLPEEELERAWTALQNGVLSSDHFSGDAPRRSKSYLFAILAALPYVDVAKIQHTRNNNNASGFGLYLLPKNSDCDAALQPDSDQGELWEYQ